MVVWPQSTEDVVKVVKTAVKYKMPVIPYSGATSLEGHFRAVSKILVLSGVSFPIPNESDLAFLSPLLVVSVSTCQRWTKSSKLMVEDLVLTSRPYSDVFFIEGNSDVICQPGIRWMDLNETLKKKG